MIDWQELDKLDILSQNKVKIIELNTSKKEKFCPFSSWKKPHFWAKLGKNIRRMQRTFSFCTAAVRISPLSDSQRAGIGQSGFWYSQVLEGALEDAPRGEGDVVAGCGGPSLYRVTQQEGFNNRNGKKKKLSMNQAPVSFHYRWRKAESCHFSSCTILL